LQNCKSSGALNQNSQTSTVDLRSNGYRRACAVDRTVRSVHGSTVDRPFKTKGYAILAIRTRSNGPGRMQAMGGGDVAGEQRRAAGARRCWPWPAFPATSTTTGWCKMMRGRLRTCSWGLWGLLCLTGGRHRTGAERPLR
jgi:hypothetical protein